MKRPCVIISLRVKYDFLFKFPQRTSIVDVFFSGVSFKSSGKLIMWLSGQADPAKMGAPWLDGGGPFQCLSQ